MKINTKLFLIFIQIAIIRNCNSQSKNVLIFGGNGFIGSETVSQLLEKKHNITIINRNTEHYDYKRRLKPYVTPVTCDRYQSLANCNGLEYMTGKYDFIIDFSAYHPVVLKDALDYFKGRFDTYIYISSDSIYEVCLLTETEFSKELHAVRYPSGPEQDKVNNRDSYGHYKLQGEEVLQQQHKDLGIKFVVLRLPDVIGPRDTTFRWWAYQTWFQFHNKLKQPLAIPNDVRSTSYVYVKDVAKTLTNIIKLISNGNLKIVNEAYNLGFPEPITLRQIFDSMQKVLGIQGMEYTYTDNASYLYPSVFRGPVNTSKASEMLQWKATPWLDAVTETIQFYKKAFYDYPAERNNMLAKLHLLITPEDFLLVSREIDKAIDDKAKQKHEESLKDEL